jgi:hypothetical protein
MIWLLLIPAVVVIMPVAFFASAAIVMMWCWMLETIGVLYPYERDAITKKWWAK